jgi:uncharacterized membrane protein
LSNDKEVKVWIDWCRFAKRRDMPFTSAHSSESHWRSAMKGISYRVFGTLITTTVSYAMMGSIKKAAVIGVVEVVAKVALYWAHERIWAKVAWGRLHSAISGHGVTRNQAVVVEAHQGTSKHAIVTDERASPGVVALT